MKKIFLLIFILVFGQINFASELPEEIEKGIRKAISIYSGSERTEQFKWYKDSFLEMNSRLEKENIPNEDKEIIVKRLQAMYGYNYPKQLSALKNELIEYKNLVARIIEQQNKIEEEKRNLNEANKKDIEILLENNSFLGEGVLKNMKNNAKKVFPKDYAMQKAYIMGSIQTYLELNKMIKK